MDTSTADALYDELGDEVWLLAEPLFEASQTFVSKRGTFLPHGAVLSGKGGVELVMAAPDGFETRLVSAVEVLPLLHRALRTAAADMAAKAVAVCEEVSINLPEQGRTAAIKVLVEHSRGLCVALYCPYQQDRRGGYSFAEVFAKYAEPEVLVRGENGAI